MSFCSFDLCLHIKTLVLKLDLDIVKIYLYILNEVTSSSGSMLWLEQTDRQTDRQTDLTEVITYSYERIIKLYLHLVLCCQDNPRYQHKRS